MIINIEANLTEEICESYISKLSGVGIDAKIATSDGESHFMLIINHAPEELIRKLKIDEVKMVVMSPQRR